MRVVHMFLADIYLFIDNDNVPQNVCVNGADLKSSGKLQLCKLHELFNLLLLPHLLFNVSFAKAAIKAEKAITMPKRKERERKKRRRFLLCHSTISICVIMRKIKALHIICPTSPHLLTAPLSPIPLSAYVSACCVSLFILIAATVDVLLSQSYNKLLHKLRVPQLGQGQGEGGRDRGRGQSVYRVYSG